MWSFTANFASNLAKNFKNLGSAIWKWLKGEGLDFEWTPLLDGFENTMEKFPDIMGDMVEGELTQKVGKKLKGFTGEFEGEFQKELAKSMQKPGETLEEGIENTKKIVEDTVAAATEATGEQKKKLTGPGKGGGGGGGGTVALTAAMDKLQEAALQQKPMKDLLKVQKEALAEQRRENARRRAKDAEDSVQKNRDNANKGFIPQAVK
jgi:hypothetical protein